MIDDAQIAYFRQSLRDGSVHAVASFLIAMAAGDFVAAFDWLDSDFKGSDLRCPDDLAAYYGDVFTPLLDWDWLPSGDIIIRDDGAEVVTILERPVGFDPEQDVDPVRVTGVQVAPFLVRRRAEGWLIADFGPSALAD